MVVGWKSNCELMASGVLQVVLINAFNPFALASMSLKVLIVAFAAEGRRAASFTDITPLLSLLSKSTAPPLPALPDKNPESLASVP